MSVFNIPLVSIVRCQFLQDPGTHSSVLMVAMDDHSGSKEPRVHFFQCSKTPVSESSLRKYDSLYYVPIVQLFLVIP